MKTTIIISFKFLWVDKVIIDTEKQTIHYCTSIFGFINDREPVSYLQFDKLKIFRKERRESVSLRAHSTHFYSKTYTDILLYNDSKSKKLHIKNVGDGQIGISIAKQICQLTNLPLIQNEPKP